MVRPASFLRPDLRRSHMLTLNETFAAPDVDHAWSVLNNLDTLVSEVVRSLVEL